MARLTIELPPQEKQTEFNLRRWAELQTDTNLARVEDRIETDRFGHLIMSPPPSAHHGSYQFRIGALLDRHMPGGRVLTECPISTADGVKAADVAWASAECLEQLGSRACFPRAPEICVEVLSPGNTEAEMREKMSLYFDAGAKEVWHCTEAGRMTFFQPGKGQAKPMRCSLICPAFPTQVNIG